MSNELEKTDQHVDAMTLVSQAVSNGAQFEQVGQLIELVKFNDSREALRSFNQAFTAAQADFPAVRKTKKAHNSLYAPLEQEVRQMQPVLSAHGFSFRHEIRENDNKTVTVRCILAHQDGHSEYAELTGPADTSGSKNAIQSIGSTVTYLRRYTFEAVTGLVTTDQDDDGRQPLQLVSDDQAATIQAKLEETGSDVAKFLRYVGKTFQCAPLNTIGDIPAVNYDACISIIQNKARKS